jgi:hypothetical protein
VEHLSLILWRERELLETLEYRRATLSSLGTTHQSRWLPRATDEVERTLASLRETELLRAIAVDVLAEELGLPPNPSIGVLADVAVEPWRTILREHASALALRLVSAPAVPASLVSFIR